jgi:hypothetical protein
MDKEHIPSDVPFSLLCEQRDGGMEIESYEQAVAQGWTYIRLAPDLPSANFLRLCPECRAEDEKSCPSSEDA